MAAVQARPRCETLVDSAAGFGWLAAAARRHDTLDGSTSSAQNDWAATWLTVLQLIAQLVSYSACSPVSAAGIRQIDQFGGVKRFRVSARL